MNNNKTYAVINLENLDKIDFSQISETSKNSIRKNNLQPPTQFTIKWINGNTPTFITDLSVPIIGNLMNQTECLELMQNNDWIRGQV